MQIFLCSFLDLLNYSSKFIVRTFILQIYPINSRNPQSTFYVTSIIPFFINPSVFTGNTNQKFWLLWTAMLPRVAWQNNSSFWLGVNVEQKKAGGLQCMVFVQCIHTGLTNAEGLL